MAAQGIEYSSLFSSLGASTLEHFHALAASKSAAEGGIDVDLDLTVFGQVVLFVVLMLALKPLLFDPLLKLFEEREKRIEGARAESHALDKASAAAQTRYEDEMQKARGQANSERDKLRAEGLRSENEILAEARAHTAKKLEDGRGVLATELASARAVLERESVVLATHLAARVLGREFH